NPSCERRHNLVSPDIIVPKSRRIALLHGCACRSSNLESQRAHRVRKIAPTDLACGEALARDFAHPTLPHHFVDRGRIADVRRTVQLLVAADCTQTDSAGLVATDPEVGVS